MDEYIIRNDAIEAAYRRICQIGLEADPKVLSIRQVIRDLPAADVREVVLCKECDFWNDWDSAGKESLGNYVCSCAYWSVEDGPVFYTSPDDFCSYGEKREEES